MTMEPPRERTGLAAQALQRDLFAPDASASSVSTTAGAIPSQHRGAATAVAPLAASREPAPVSCDTESDRDGEPTDAPEGRPTGDALQETVARWRRDPRGAYAAWKRAALVRGKREFDEHSLEQYTSMWSRFCAYMEVASDASGKPLRAPLTLDAVQPVHVERFLASLRGGRLGHKPAAASTTRRYLFLLERTFTHLALLGVVQDNPCAGLPALARHQAHERPARVLLRPAQEEAFIRWSLEQPLSQPVHRWEHVRNRALRLVLLASGITVAEARTLRVADIAFGRGAPEQLLADGAAPLATWRAILRPTAEGDSPEPLHVPRPDAGDGWATLELPQHGRVPARSVPVAGFAITALAQWLALREGLGTAGELVFNTKRLMADVDPELARPAPEALSPEEIYDIVAIALRGSGYDGPRPGPATLRNAFLARQIREGRPLERIRDWAGLATTDSLLALQRQVPMRHDGVHVA